MSCVGLTEQEEQHLLVLMEGDVSDVDIEGSDEEEDFPAAEVLNDNIDVQPSTSKDIGVPYIEDRQPEDADYSSEDDLPLSYFKNSNENLQKKRKKVYHWRRKDLEQIDSTCNSSFSEPPEPEMTALNYFKYFVSDNLISNIAYQTNLYSVQKTGFSVNTNEKEMEQFLGVHILSGIVKMPSYRMYWAEATRYAPIADVMSRNRFDKLRNFIHFSDNSTMKKRDDPDYDKLFKVRPVVDTIRATLATLEHEEHNSVDEIIVPFKGRSSLKQYIKNKPHKWGIKLFARAGCSGIIYDFEVYVGKGTLIETTELGISGDIVIRLCKDLPKQENYKVYCDNWFTSPELLCKLKQLGILAIGTVRNNRLPNCNFKTDKDLKSNGRGSFDYRTETDYNMVAVKWYDNRAVHLLSTYKGIYPVNTVNRWSVAEKSYIEVQQPEIVRQYNSFMGGVDLHDMLVSLYRINFRVRRYYLRIFYNIIDMCVVNSWLLYRRHMAQKKQKYKTLVDFRSEIAQALIRAGKEPNRTRGRPASSRSSSAASSPVPIPPTKTKAKVAVPVDDVRYDKFGHWPVHIEPKQRCRLCITAYSRVQCDKCKMTLCFTKDKNCFKSFHCKY